MTSGPAGPQLRVGLRRVLAHLRVDRILLALALVGGSVLRIVGLGTVGLNSDEAVYAAQSASLAGNPHFTQLFPVVRAHPLLVQVLISPLYADGVPDTVGRYVAALFGIGTVALTYVAGRVLYGPRVGALAALFLAVMPYHLTVTRQILLDGPMAFFTTGALVCLAVARSPRPGSPEPARSPSRRLGQGRTGRGRGLVAAGACIGLAALCKEVAVIFVGAGFVFVSLESRLWRPRQHLIAAAVVALVLTACYPTLTSLAGGSSSGQAYLMWQLTRQPNHGFEFYLITVGAAIGFALLAVAALGLAARRVTGRALGWRELLLGCWAAVPLLYFQIWPVKGFSYLTPLAPVVALLAARALVPLRRGRRNRALTALACGVIASLVVPAAAALVRPPNPGLAGAGGTVGGREAGRWVAAHLPDGAQLLTIGPSMANLIQYYGGHRSDGLSVSPNPLHHNPTYQPVRNPDAALRAGTYQYVVWDVYSARRSPTFAANTLTLARRHNGQVVYVERGRLGARRDQQLVVIYEVTP
jgi:4-amino-4-deoxy-L-arabinose transferase-like glycosyltransferase